MFKYKNVLIYGYGASGKAVERVLIEKDVNYKIYDDNKRLGGGKYLFSLKKADILNFDLIILSPGVSIFNKYVRFAESVGVRVISELEFGFLMCPYPIIAVTGTNGKTTVTKMLEHVLNLSGLNVKALGNVGEPLSEVVNYKQLDFVVCEVSSFQLEATYKFKPFINTIYIRRT
jgi:UDP-N-acetylmuramoylalanine--D-glutamate ligase